MSLMMRVTGFVLLFLAFDAVSSLPFVDLCPEMDPMQNFDIQKFQGKWYEAMRVRCDDPVRTKCNSETFTLVDDNHLSISAEFVALETGSNITSFGNATIDSKTPSVWSFVFPEVEMHGDLVVLSTDYVNYAIMYTCKTYGVWENRLAWWLTRQPNPSPDLINQLVEAFEKWGGNTTVLENIDHSSCSN